MDTTIERLLRSADAIIEVDADNTYLGFCSPGTTLTSQPRWAICKIAKAGTTTTIKWANAQKVYNLILDNYASYTYNYRNF